MGELSLVVCLGDQVHRLKFRIISQENLSSQKSWNVKKSRSNKLVFWLIYMYISFGHCIKKHGLNQIRVWWPRLINELQFHCDSITRDRVVYMKGDCSENGGKIKAWKCFSLESYAFDFSDFSYNILICDSLNNLLRVIDLTEKGFPDALNLEYLQHKFCAHKMFIFNKYKRTTRKIYNKIDF